MQASKKFRAVVTLGLVVVLWDFFCLFSGWVVAPQREVGTSTLMFCFSGLFPVIGLIAVWLHRRWGAWLLLVSPWIAALGMFGLHGTEKAETGWFLLLFVVPTSVLGFIFQRLLSAPKIA